MATTKIWPVKDSLARVVDYAQNPDKTIYSDLQAVLHYAANTEKTIEGKERTMFVTGVNCNRDTAFQEMQAVKERFGKTGGNIAYHAYQSFKPGEVTPELCHRLGVELAKRMWGDEYQVLVATHFNTGTYHNHFVVNSVGLWDGRKFNCGKRAYYQFRQLSDDLCKEYQLSTIKNPNGKTPRSIYFAEKNGEPTRYNLMREALDAALKVSVDGNDLRKALREQGYELDANPTHKYATLRRIGSKKAVRLHRLGEGYDLPALRERIEEPWFQSHGQWGGRGYANIAPGDAIFFDWDLDGSADHVGIVIDTDGSRVYTVEGNSGDACKIKSYDLNYQCIKGYGLMNWN